MPVSTVSSPFRGGVDADRAPLEAGAGNVTASLPEHSQQGRDVDQRVVKAFCAGDVEALGAIYDHYSRAVWAVAMSVLRNRQLAEDATQETFMRAWKGADRFDWRRPLTPWLVTIARRTAVDVHRRESRPTRGAHAQEQEVAVTSPGIERAWETWEIKLALDQLPDDERAVVWMAHYQGMSHSQIAERLETPVGTVKSRSFRAHKRLARLLAHMIEPQGSSA